MLTTHSKSKGWEIVKNFLAYLLLNLSALYVLALLLIVSIATSIVFFILQHICKCFSQLIYLKYLES